MWTLAKRLHEAVEAVTVVEEPSKKELPGYDVQRITPDKYKITSPKGDTYTCAMSAGKWRCSCKGFKFRQQCKHVTILPPPRGGR